jgi:acetyl esterase/lipase
MFYFAHAWHMPPAPEVPFPGPVHDVEDTLRWVSQQPWLDSQRVAVSGFSSGGTLALVAASVLRRRLERDLDIVAVATLYAMTDLTIPPEDRKVPHPVSPLPVWAMNLYLESYAPEEDSRANPLASPAFAESADFPPSVVIISGEGDVLMPEEVSLAGKLEKEQGREVINSVLKDMPHAFDKGCEEGTARWNEREETYALVAKTLKHAFASS